MRVQESFAKRMKSRHNQNKFLGGIGARGCGLLMQGMGPSSSVVQARITHAQQAVHAEHRMLPLLQTGAQQQRAALGAAAPHPSVTQSLLPPDPLRPPSAAASAGTSLVPHMAGAPLPLPLLSPSGAVQTSAFGAPFTIHLPHAAVPASSSPLRMFLPSGAPLASTGTSPMYHAAAPALQLLDHSGGTPAIAGAHLVLGPAPATQHAPLPQPAPRPQPSDYRDPARAILKQRVRPREGCPKCKVAFADADARHEYGTAGKKHADAKACDRWEHGTDIKDLCAILRPAYPSESDPRLKDIVRELMPTLFDGLTPLGKRDDARKQVTLYGADRKSVPKCYEFYPGIEILMDGGGGSTASVVTAQPPPMQAPEAAASALATADVAAVQASSGATDAAPGGSGCLSGSKRKAPDPLEPEDVASTSAAAQIEAVPAPSAATDTAPAGDSGSLSGSKRKAPEQPGSHQ